MLVCMTVPCCDFTDVRYPGGVEGGGYIARGATGRWCAVMYAGPGSVAKTKIQPAINTISIREDGLAFKSIPSLTTQGGSTAKKADQMYSGDNLIGISICHKSHLSPVFSNEHALELASMRR